MQPALPISDSDRLLADILSPGLSVLFCGLNPGMRAVKVGHHFDGQNNRFWQTLYLSGFTPKQLRPDEERSLLSYGCGLTTLVERATAGASDIAIKEFSDSSHLLEEKIQEFSPKWVAFLGKDGFAAISGQRHPHWGEQQETFGGAKVWLLPNPSGRNRAFTLGALVASYRELRAASISSGA